MLVKFFHHGTGKSDSAMAYLLSKAPLQYLAGARDAKGAIRDPAPAVVRGNPALTRRLINQLFNKKHRYVSGVLSFRELISPQAEQRIIDRFEATAFPGLHRGQFDCLWIRHAHNHRTELHFLVPRCELSSGRALNIRPPHERTEELYDTFRKLINHDFHLKDPDRSVAHLSPHAVQQLREKLDRLTAARAKYNRQRFPARSANPIQLTHPRIHEDRTRPFVGSVGPARTPAHDTKQRTGSALERLGRAMGALGAASACLEHSTQRFGCSVGKIRARAPQAVAQARTPAQPVSEQCGPSKTLIANRDSLHPEPEELELVREDGE
jgi:hypothetical protein